MQLDQETAAREARLRRKAERHALVLTRSRSRSADDPSYGLWRLGRRSARGKFVAITDWTDLDGIDDGIDKELPR